MWGAIFQVPALAGLGEHWKLAENEASSLSEVTEALLISMPARRRKALEKSLQATMPLAMFVITLAIIAGPRVTKSQRLMLERKRAAVAGPVRVAVPLSAAPPVPPTGGQNATPPRSPVFESLAGAMTPDKAVS